MGEPDEEELAPGAIKDMLVATGPFPSTTSHAETSGPVTNLGVVGTTTRKAPEASEATPSEPAAKKMRTEENKPETVPETEKKAQ